eukprot:TRINITY_DN52175_c0_g1_i1.p1 TRINITY_DN52175_c0_g1~~TRINITY_DN52175_c0_g1_i1.p1  ORF type:complete len:253 (-),score=24.24 TRINITY_DN52175_c0_g1_i1:152-889(-)
MADDSLAYSMQGILWYLQNNIVTKSCPRNFNVTRITRFKATVYNTDAPFLAWGGQFGPFLEFHKGRCTSPACTESLRTFGQVVGCLPWSPYQGGVSYGNTSQSYSLPDSGACAKPDGSPNCTWSLEPAGEVRLDELEGISSYAAFCAAGNIEYDQSTNTGRGCTFWDNQNVLGNARRVAELQAVFHRMHPSIDLPEPLCDSRNAECRYHEDCRALPGKCCPADDGIMLSCCGYQPEVLTGASMFT